MKRLFFAAVLLSGCATAPPADTLAAYPAAIAGRYDNSAQYALAPADMKDPPAGAGDDWLDASAVTFSVVAVPALAPAAVYAEWTRPDGSVSKQRLWAFRKGAAGVMLDLYELREPARFAGQGAGAFAMLTAADVKDATPGCTLAVSMAGAGAWNAQTNPETCKSGDAEIDIRVTVMPTGVLYQEQGRRGDGGYAFRIPAPAPYDYRRR